MFKRLVAFFVIGYFALQIPACTPWKSEEIVPLPDTSTTAEIVYDISEEDILYNLDDITIAD